MIRDALFALFLLCACACLGCGDDVEPPPTCEVYGVTDGSVRCFTAQAICYVGLPDYRGCQCNGVDRQTQVELCAMTTGFYDGAGR